MYNSIAELCKEKKMHFFKPIPFITYIPPKLTEGKEWYISYSVINPETGKFKRFRIKCNRIHNIKERRKTARTMIAGIEERLSLGWTPYLENKAPRVYNKLFETLDLFLKVKGKENEEESMRSYRSFIRTFSKWLRKSGFHSESLCCSINKTVALSFINDIEDNDKISAATYNNYLSFFHNLFNWMINKGYISENPFEGIPKKARRHTKKTRRILSSEELSTLVNHLQKENLEYLAICMICYCCFMRPKEIALLKCKDIDLNRQYIFVSAAIAKNDNDSYRTIPNDLLPLLRLIDLSEPDNYVFGEHSDYDFRPGKKKIISRKIARYWSDYVRPACNFPMELQFYSLKDTGITNMLGEGVPISFVQQQADHSSVAVTAIYVGKKASANEELKKADMLPKL